MFFGELTPLLEESSAVREGQWPVGHEHRLSVDLYMPVVAESIQQCEEMRLDVGLARIRLFDEHTVSGSVPNASRSPSIDRMRISDGAMRRPQSKAAPAAVHHRRT